MRPRSGRRHGEAGRAVYLCGVRKGRMGGPEGVPGEPQRPRFAPPRERRGKPASGKTNTQTPHRKGSVFGAGSGYYLCQK